MGKPAIQSPLDSLDRRFSVAPMLDWSDRHERYLLRLFSHHAVLYTEMVTTGALRYGDQHRFLAHDPIEHPVALQLGGSDPVEMAWCAELGERAGFDEININVGCPSDRVQSGRFGACLMKEPELVARCVQSMQDKVRIPVTIKCRIGVDSRDRYCDLQRFVEQVSEAGCRTFIVHARKAWLKGMSPKQNREIPPLRYGVVYRLKQEFPQLEIIVNGGICTLTEIENHLVHTDGVMVGREAYRNPVMLSLVDRELFGSSSPQRTALQVLDHYKLYIARELDRGTPLQHMTRHLLGFFQGLPGARAWRRHLSCYAPNRDAGLEVVQEAEALIRSAVELSQPADDSKTIVL